MTVVFVLKTCMGCSTFLNSCLAHNTASVTGGKFLDTTGLPYEMYEHIVCDILIVIQACIISTLKSVLKNVGSIK